MRYDAGVEEFLSLVKNAEYVVTNSFHGMIFSVQFCRPFAVFSREQCDNKIEELLDLFGIPERLIKNKDAGFAQIDYKKVKERICEARTNSFDFLRKEVGLL